MGATENERRKRDGIGYAIGNTKQLISISQHTTKLNHTQQNTKKLLNH